MKKHPKFLQVDSRGQIVIPKEIRKELDIDESTGFWAYCIAKEGIFMKKIDAKELAEHPELQVLREKAEKIGIKKTNLETSEKEYKREKKSDRGFEEI